MQAQKQPLTLRERLSPRRSASVMARPRLVLWFYFLVIAVQPTFAETPLDEISRQASQLEAELGKYNDAATEAADVMVKLVALYHSDARVFGLVRIGNRFVATHPNDPRHKDVMLQTIDGLQAMSRNKELIVACRQFLFRYPQAKECGEIEIRLAETLAADGDQKSAAAAFHAIWNREKNNASGRLAATRAIERYTSLGKDQIEIGAKLAEDLLDLTDGTFAVDVGLKSVHSYAKIGKWAESNRAAQRLLQKKVVKDPPPLRELHLRMAENYARLKQHTSSVRSYAEAREIKDDHPTHAAMIDQLSYAKASSQEIGPIAKQYAQTYTDRKDQFRGLSVLAQAYVRENNPGAAISLLHRVLAFDAITNDSGQVYVQQNATDPDRMQESEKALLAAIEKNPSQAAYLRYVLAFSLYRDRMKQEEKTRAILRELIQQSPTDDGYSRAAVDWLLNSARDEKEFDEELARILKARRAHPELATFAKFVGDWQQGARRDAKRKERSQIAKRELDRADDGPVEKLIASQTFGHSSQQAKIRDQLLADDTIEKLNETYINRLLDVQGYFYRHYVHASERKASATYYGKLALRQPKEFEPARKWLESATDYAADEVAKESALHVLSFPPQDCGSDVWRRLMKAADKNSDAELARQSLVWMTQAQAKFGIDPGSASYIGDVLHKLGLKPEAIKLWQTHLTTDRRHYESRECASRLIRELEEDKVIAFLEELISHDTPFHGRYATWLADEYLKRKDYTRFAKVIADATARRAEHPFEAWDIDHGRINEWVARYRRETEVTDEERRQVHTAVASMQYGTLSSAARLAMMERDSADPSGRMKRILACQRATVLVDDRWNAWDALFPFSQSFLTSQQYMEAATIASGLLANFSKVDDRRLKSARDIVTQSYTQMGSVGLTIDESSPIAPLMQAALYLRLGDEALALATYDENRALFDSHRNELPIDLIRFVCQQRMTASGDSNHEYVEDVLRGWLVAHSESKQVDEESKAEIQLLLATNYFKAKRYDVARSEYTSTINRYPDSKQAIEARFGIGESFMAQKVYDQAELVFEELSRNRELEIVVRAEFLRGVLAFRRGDRDDAREIFRSVLERVPNVELANQALFSLSEVYGVEERYIDQLNLLRTVGRLGRRSTRLHSPGMPLSIVVHDSDLGISRGHNKIPVIVTTHPSGDVERVMLTSAGAGRGLFRADVETRLGDAQPDDGVLQLLGGDTIQCDYPDEFKSEFKRVPLSDVEIRIASNAKFEAASSKIVDQVAESFSDRVAREAAEEENANAADLRVSQIRPENQIKPGNDIHFRVIDPDRDRTNDRDQVPIKLLADSGDHLQLLLTETEPHTGIFEGTAKTAELPAGALASDTAIDHNPLMAIDHDEKTMWLAEPDGATPKTLTVDMKDLRQVTQIKMTTPDATKSAPVRFDLRGSHDGEFWFRIASQPKNERVAAAETSFGRMRQRVYVGKYYHYSQWNQVVDLGNNREAAETQEVDELAWAPSEKDDQARNPHAVIWSGKFIQPRDGAVRIMVKAAVSAIAVGESLELPIGTGKRSVDLWLARGSHDLTLFAATNANGNPVEATIARASLQSERVTLSRFQASDFDLDDPAANVNPKPTSTVTPISLNIADTKIDNQSGQFGEKANGEQPLLHSWTSLEDSAAWEFDVEKPGVYELWLDCAHPGEASRFAVEVEGRSFSAEVPDTRNWNRFQDTHVTTLLFQEPGRKTLRIKPIAITNGGLMDLRGITLRSPTSAAILAMDNAWDIRFPTREIRYARFEFNEYLGESVAVNHIQIAGENPDDVFIPTKQDVLALASNDSLEIAAGDTVTATYTDMMTQNETGSSQLLSKKLTATYFNAQITPITYAFTRDRLGRVSESQLKLKRIDAKERIVIEVRDYDQDRTPQRDEIEVEVAVNEGEVLKLIATETEEYSGIFTKEVDTSDHEEEGKLKVQPGDQVRLRYFDAQNTFPGHGIAREAIVYVSQPSNGQIRILQTRTKPRTSDNLGPPQIEVLDQPQIEKHPDAANDSLVALDAPLTIEVVDPDRAKNSGSTVKVALLTDEGSAVIVECVVSNAYVGRRQSRDIDQALQEGRFVGQVNLQLGGVHSPELVPQTAQMPRNLIGSVLAADRKSDDALSNPMIVRVLNVTGKDKITAAYQDKENTDHAPLKRLATGRLVTDGVLTVTDREYKDAIKSVHVGEKLYITLADPDQDQSDERDRVTVLIQTERGESESVTLSETLAHSGLFAGSFTLAASETPTPNNMTESQAEIESYFGDTITLTYNDPTSATPAESFQCKQSIPVVVGTDGLVTAFTKTFNDESLAVETKFRIAESYFELFKSHKQLERGDDQKRDLEAGRRVLREVMEDYPDPKYAPRIAYLLGQFAQELEQWDEAIRSYEMIIRRYPDHTLAADARYKLAQSYEQAGDFDEALEAYVTLAATHPNSPLIASVMIRISDYFYQKEDFDVAAQVGEKFGERFEGHEHAAEMAFRIGQCYYKMENFKLAGTAFDQFAKTFPDDELSSDSLFWSGEAYRLGRNNQEAFRRYNRCRWDYPESEAAKYSRGRLALPEMLQQFEAEANSVDDE